MLNPQEIALLFLVIFVVILAFFCALGSLLTLSACVQRSLTTGSISSSYCHRVALLFYSSDNLSVRVKECAGGGLESTLFIISLRASFSDLFDLVYLITTHQPSQTHNHILLLIPLVREYSGRNTGQKRI